MVGKGETQTFVMTADDGYQIAEVLVDGETVGTINRYTFQDVQEPHTISVSFEPASDPDLDSGVSGHLNTRDHLAYVSGYPDQTFGPNQDLTRAEAAQMFYNLLLDQRISDHTVYSDVSDQAWYSDAVQTLSSLGVVEGYPDGSFRPYDPISRAEVTAVVNRMLNRAADPAFLQSHASEVNPFLDVSLQHWAYDSILEAANSHDYARQSGTERWSKLL